MQPWIVLLILFGASVAAVAKIGHMIFEPGTVNSRSHFKRISVEEHLSAKSRIKEARTKYTLVINPDGSQFKWFSEPVQWDDIGKSEGYGCTIGDMDRFGWPTGHLDSPCRLYDGKGT